LDILTSDRFVADTEISLNITPKGNLANMIFSSDVNEVNRWTMTTLNKLFIGFEEKHLEWFQNIELVWGGNVYNLVVTLKPGYMFAWNQNGGWISDTTYKSLGFTPIG
ncbi:MAG: hypothetical protein ACRCXE_02325, partial [Metamycoplasmataceae bacterium]